jgi:hypothetical protein
MKPQSNPSRPASRRHLMVSAGVLACTFAMAQPAAAALLTGFVDEFNDGSLDPAWTVSFESASGWDFTEAGTELKVRDITSTVANTTGGQTWSIVRLSRTGFSLGDFELDFDFGWDSRNLASAMQQVMVGLYSADNDRIALAGYQDKWAGNLGGKYAAVVGDVFTTGVNSLPQAGTAQIDITRSGQAVSILWGGTEILTGSAAYNLDRVEIEFGFYNYPSAGTTFGNETVDRIALAGTLAGTSEVPIPPAAALLGSALVALVSLKRRRSQSA